MTKIEEKYGRQFERHPFSTEFNQNSVELKTVVTPVPSGVIMPCNCLDKAPTYPIYRDTLHIPNCPWYHVEMLEKRVTELERWRDIV